MANSLTDLLDELKNKYKAGVKQYNTVPQNSPKTATQVIKPTMQRAASNIGNYMQDRQRAQTSRIKSYNQVPQQSSSKQIIVPTYRSAMGQLSSGLTRAGRRTEKIRVPQIPKVNTGNEIVNHAANYAANFIPGVAGYKITSGLGKSMAGQELIDKGSSAGRASRAGQENPYTNTPNPVKHPFLFMESPAGVDTFTGIDAATLGGAGAVFGGLKAIPKGAKIIGKAKYADEAADAIKAGARNVDEVADAGKRFAKIINPETSINRIKSKIGFKDKVKDGAKSPYNWLDNIRTRLENEYHPIEKTAKTAAKKGEKFVASLDDPRVLVKRRLGIADIAEGELMGFGDIVRPVEDSVDDLNTYMVSKRALALGERGKETGIDPKDAARAVQTLESKYKGVAEKLYMYQRSVMRNYLVDTGVMSKELYSKIIQANPEYVPFKRVMDDIERVSGATKSMPIKEIKGSLRAIENPMESIIENTYRTIAYGEENRLWKSVATLGDRYKELGITKVKPQMVPVAVENGKTIIRPKAPSGADVMTVMVDGKPTYYQIPKELANIYSKFSKETNMFVKLMAAPAKTVRTLATGANPQFGVLRNPLRDQMTALWNSESGYKPFVDMFRGLSHYAGDDTLYRQYLLGGGGQSYMVSLDRAFKKKTLEELLKSPFAKRQPWTMLRSKGVIGKLQDISELTEAGTRLGEFGKALDKTGDIYKASKSAREVSVDFGRIGTDMRSVNMIKAFMNARLQGGIQALKSAKNHPVRSATIGVTFGAIPAALLYSHNRKYPEYADIEDWEKINNWIIMTGEPGSGIDSGVNPISIPRDPIFGMLFGGTTENYLAHLDKSNPNALDNMYASLLSLSPAQNVGDFIPDAVKPVAEHAFNYNTFLQKPIVPEYQKALPEEAQYHKGTREVAKMIGSKIGVSPNVVDNYLYGYFPGLGTNVINVADFALGGNKFEDVKKLPFFSVFAVSGTGKADREVKNAYFDIQDRQKAISSIKRSANYSTEQKESLIKYEVEEIAKDMATMQSYQEVQQGNIPKFGEDKQEDGFTYERKGVTGDAQAATGEPGSIPTDKETFELLYKDVISDVQRYQKKEVLLPHEVRDELGELMRPWDIEENQNDLKTSQEFLDKMRSEHPGLVFEAELGTYGREHPATIKVEDRGGWAVEQLKKLPATERQDMINRFWEEGVLTSQSNGVAQYIEDEYGVSVWDYTGADEKLIEKLKDSDSKSSGGSAKKITGPAKVNITALPKTSKVTFTAPEISGDVSGPTVTMPPVQQAPDASEDILAAAKYTPRQFRKPAKIKLTRGGL